MSSRESGPVSVIRFTAMLSAARRLALAALLVAGAVTASAASAATMHGGPLTGTWSGRLAGQSGYVVKRQHIVIVVNARETSGTWRLSRSCYGRLTLDSISNGYHHYLRRHGRGSTCAAGEIDCLRRVGANVYDAVTARRGSAYGPAGTLRRVRATA